MRKALVLPLLYFLNSARIVSLKTIGGAVGMNSAIFNNPFLIWGKYRRRFRKATLTVSFQFHHTRMDGAHAGRFLALLQENIRNMKGTVLYGETDNPDC